MWSPSDRQEVVVLLERNFSQPYYWLRHLKHFRQTFLFFFAHPTLSVHSSHPSQPNSPHPSRHPSRSVVLIIVLIVLIVSLIVLFVLLIVLFGLFIVLFGLLIVLVIVFIECHSALRGQSGGERNQVMK